MRSASWLALTTMLGCGAFPSADPHDEAAAPRSSAAGSGSAGHAPQTAGSGGSAGPVAGGGAGSPGGSGGASSGSGAGGVTQELTPLAACDFPHSTSVVATNPGELAVALANAAPGTLIRIADGTYAAAWAAKVSGTAEAPIILCGSRAAVLQAGDGQAVFHLQASHWILSGFTLTGGEKGLLLDGAGHNLLTGLSVHDIGHEAVHFRKHSSDNVLASSEIYETGQSDPGIGEGVYIGSSHHGWPDLTGSAPDRSDRNLIEGNVIGPNVRAELIDIKEGTTGGVIRGNTLDGRGMSGDGYADSWLDVKGNGYLIEANQGSDALADGFQIHVELEGWGNDNTFHDNVARVDGPGYGFQVFNGASGTIIGCDNEVSGAGKGLANIDCTP